MALPDTVEGGGLMDALVEYLTTEAKRNERAALEAKSDGNEARYWYKLGEASQCRQALGVIASVPA